MGELEEIRKSKLKRLMEKGKTLIKIEINDKNFQEKVIEQSKKIPVVVDFWSNWCMPCLMLGPILEKFAKEYNGKFVLAKANIDETGTIAQNYGVMSIPAVKMFKYSKVVDEFIGALAEPLVREWLNKNIEMK